MNVVEFEPTTLLFISSTTMHLPESARSSPGLQREWLYIPAEKFVESSNRINACCKSWMFVVRFLRALKFE